MGHIRKSPVTKGVYWVDIPEADLRILCGCPADSIKHLMKKGLVVPVEVKGVMTETGPNAILLSDDLIQNGSLSNLAEFPVLQMLYRQGMILPNHPNNTGRKPLLMGSESMVQAQMRYIYRGNYGLISKEEMMLGGMSEERALEEMRIKLRFAFGNIRTTDELLDTMTVGSRDSQIRDGVSIRRENQNVFVISYKDESVTVDLNLGKGEEYEAPYPLYHSNPRWEYFSVIHSGNGDGWDISRPAMASIIMYQGEIYLIDAGPNLHHSLTALGIGVNDVRGIFHTHAHDDHFCGLTALMQSDHKIEHYATPGVRASIVKKWSSLLMRPEKEFSDYFELHDLVEDIWNDVSGLHVKPVFSPHPLETTIMFFRARGGEGYKSYAHLADITSRRVLEGFINDTPDEPGISQKLFDKVWENYLTEADVKKIDVGGGLIHGEAEDFRADPSRKIVLSHTAMPLTPAEKEIGSGATFGSEDVLIKGKQDFLRFRAYRHLNELLPNVRDYDLRMLLNGDIIRFNPESILYKRGDEIDNLYMVITGVVDMIDSETGTNTQLSAGSIVGETSEFECHNCGHTFRAATHVHALRLPVRQMHGVIRDNGMSEHFERIRKLRHFLRNTWLFGGSMSTAVRNRISEALILAAYKPGETIDHTQAPAVFLVQSGKVDICFDNKVIETIGPGDFLGEGYTLFDTPCITSGKAVEPTIMLVIPTDTLREIPAVRWKLFEVFRHRVSSIVDNHSHNDDIFTWRPEYSTCVEKQDNDHKELLRRAGEVYQCLLADEPCDVLKAKLDAVLSFTKEHFTREIGWYRDAGFPELEHHMQLHRHLLQDISRKADRILAHSANRDLEFLIFFKDWLIDHILTEDRKFGAMFSNCGI